MHDSNQTSLIKLEAVLMQKCAIDPLHLPPPSSPILPGLHGSDNALDYI